MSRSNLAERGRAGIGRSTGRVDVVDEADRSRNLAFSDDAAPHVPASLRESEPTLTRERTPTAKRFAGGQPPQLAERDSKPSRRNDSALPRPLRVAGDVREGVDVGTRDHLGDERRRLGGQPPAPMLLPRADEHLGATVVDHGRAGTGEGKAATGAFSAPAHGPRAGRAAALADGRAQANERAATRLAERCARPLAHCATLREQQVEQHLLIVGDYPSRLCEKMRSASWSVSAEPMSYHSPGKRQV